MMAGGPGMGRGGGGRGGGMMGPPPHRNAPSFPHPPQFRPQSGGPPGPGGGFPRPPPNFQPPHGPPGGGRGRGGQFGGPQGSGPYGQQPGGLRPQPPQQQHQQQQVKPKAKPGADGDEEMIESEFVEIEDDFIERPRRPRKQPPPTQPPARGGKGKGDDDEWPLKPGQHHNEGTALLPRRRAERQDLERQRYKVIKFIYLFLFAVASLEVVLITSLSGWLMHMVSCIIYESCSPTQERLMSFGLYFGILCAIFIVPFLIGALGIATSSPRILWFFSFVSALIDVIIVVLLSVYVRWEVALGMIPLVLCSLFGFAMSSVLSHEAALRGPEAMRNRCCLFLCN
jgi:hypothetical protein